MLAPASAQAEGSSGPPVLLVDLTDLTGGELHNRFDKFACNDPEAKARWSKKIATDFEGYLHNEELISRGVVHVTTNRGWKDLLSRLRDEKLGHFFCPVFSP